MLPPHLHWVGDKCLASRLWGRVGKSGRHSSRFFGESSGIEAPHPSTAHSSDFDVGPGIGFSSFALPPPFLTPVS